MPRELDTFIDSELDESALQAFIQGTGSEHYFGTQGRQKSVYRVDRQGNEYSTSPTLQNFAIQCNSRRGAISSRSGRAGTRDSQGGGKNSQSMRIEAYVAVPVGTVPSLDEFVRGMRESMGADGRLRKVVFDEMGAYTVKEEEEEEEKGAKGKGKKKGGKKEGGKK